MKNRVFFLFITLAMSQISFFVNPVQADEYQPYFESETILQVGPATLDSELIASRPNEIMYGAVKTEVGVEKSGFTIGTLYRRDYQVLPNKDAADYFYATEKSHQLTPGRTYQIQLEKEAFEAKGLHITKRFQPKENLRFSFGGSALQAFGLQKGVLSGYAKVSKKGKTHSYNVKLDYQYSQDELLDRMDVIKPDGYGYSFDTQINWQPTSNIAVNAAATDLFGAIHWSEVPYTTGLLTSDVKGIDEDGFVTYNPHLSGHEGYKQSMRQTLKPKFDTQVDYQLTPYGHALSVVTKHIPQADYWGIGGKLPMKNGIAQVTIWPENKMLNIGFANKRAEINVGMDGLQPSDMHALWVSVGLH